MRLELSTYMVPETFCKANPDHFTCDNVREPIVDTTIKHFFNKETEELCVFLRIENTDDFEDEDPYEFNFEMFGTFRVVPDDGESLDELEYRYRALVINGAQMLYSGARDYVHTVTGKGPYGPVRLPTAYISGDGIEYRAID